MPRRRPSRGRIDAASSLWPRRDDIPPDGDYLVTTTWRDVLDAAMTVGRDPARWLSALPDLAWSELIARWSPLAAYLRRVTVTPNRSGYAVEPNAVYREGTEKTAQAAFGYRIGMTMAEWACRGLMGLGPTLHAEADRPNGYGAAWHAASGLPDLIGDHWRPPATWLIEAKGARKPGLSILRKGALQVARPGLMSGPHVRALCGTSLEHRVFMTIDVEVLPAPTPPPDDRRPRPESDDATLLALARSRMLTYYALASLPADAVSVRPVGTAIADRATRDGGGLVYPLELDDSTNTERHLARNPVAYTSQRSPDRRLDMLTGNVPGTGIIVGMSRRLFAACQNLAVEDQEDWSDLPVQIDRHGMRDLTLPFDADDGKVDDLVRERREFLADREAFRRPRQLSSARDGFERGRNASWTELLNAQPTLDTETRPSLLESATEDVYLAIPAVASGQ